MRILKEGDRGQAACPTCEAVVATHYEYRTVHLEQTGVDVENVLVGVCNVCDSTITIPAQSTPKLKEARERKLVPVNARVPRHLNDVLHLIADHYKVSYSSFCSPMLRYYVHQLATNDQLALRVRRLARTDLA